MLFVLGGAVPGAQRWLASAASAGASDTAAWGATFTWGALYATYGVNCENVFSARVGSQRQMQTCLSRGQLLGQDNLHNLVLLYNVISCANGAGAGKPAT